ncbi:MAG TPA: glycosyltransferase family 87 protein [Candidatus Dormibacteraeota bacterium]
MYIGARIGLEHGWSHVYSLGLQHQLFSQMRPATPFGDGERFLSPPPAAWLIVPLTLVGPQAAFFVWLFLSVAALAGAWWLAAPGTGRLRALWLLAAVAWYPVLYSLSLGQPVIIVLLGVVACWRLAESGKPYLAGAVLGLSVLKPQVAIAVPVVLLVAGRWRIAAGWAATIGALAVVSLLVIGPQGVNDYRSLLAEAQNVVNNRYFTWAYLVGPGTISYVLQVIFIALGIAAAYLNRKATLARLIALGLLVSMLSATYWHLQDFAILVGAAWLFIHDEPPAWQRAWLVVVALAGELAWPLTPLPMLLAATVWFAVLAIPRRAADRAPVPAS